ncbi:MAG: polyprenyl synthetase family protein [Bdellovibrionota bacterium]|nr:polyprenyl synthetase family protein [Bdellovibrionota bacterium]
MIKDFFSSLPQGVLQEIGGLRVEAPSKDCNKEINELLKRTVLLGGKRLRPLLTFLMGDLLNVNSESLRPYARAVELVHAASLSHDDVIDNAEMRRGVPSINILGSNKKAILAGDYLLADVIVDLTARGNLKLVSEMSSVIKDLAEGEWIQLEASQERNYDWNVIETIARKKTSSVMSYCCVAPAILGGHSDEVVELCRDFGINLGLGFQLMDDALDFKTSSEKDLKTDLRNGIVNAVILSWFEKNPNLYTLYKQKEQSLESLDEKVAGEDLNNAINDVEALALEKLRKCKRTLQDIGELLPSSENFRKALPTLETVIDFLAKRTL